MKTLLYFTLSLFLFSQSELSFSKPLQNKNCIWLGANPSFIVKFKTKTTGMKSLNQLNSAKFAEVNALGFEATKVVPMSQGSTVVFFKVDPKKTVNKLGVASLRGSLKTVDRGCYTEKSVNEFAAVLKENPDILTVTPNALMSALEVKDSAIITPQADTVSSLQWHLLNSAGGVDAVGAWGISKGNSNAIIAVLDTGIYNNTALNPNLLPGVHFTNGGTNIGPGATPSCATCGDVHGTHVAGIIASSGTYAYGRNVYGVAPSAKVLPINVFTRLTSPNCSGGAAECSAAYTSDIVNAINWLAGDTFSQLSKAPRVAGINMSLGGAGTCGSAFDTAITRAANLNIPSIVAAGNSNTTVGQPANCAKAIAVASVGPTGLRANYSNYGSIVKIAAPGGDTSISYPVNGSVYSTLKDNYGYMSGTSMAAPHVAGVVALIYSVNPNLTLSNLISLIQQTATPFPQSSDPERNCIGTKSCGAGIINANRAIRAASNSSPTPTPTPTPTPAPQLKWTPNVKISTLYNGYVYISWNAALWYSSTGQIVTPPAPNVYSVWINGAEICKNFTKLNCTISGMLRGYVYKVEVTASDANRTITLRSGIIYYRPWY